MAILKLNYDRAGYEGLTSVELRDGDMTVHPSGLRRQAITGNLAALVAEENFFYTPTDANHLLTRRQVSMNRDDRTRFERIEHPHRAIVGRVAQVIMHA